MINFISKSEIISSNVFFQELQTKNIWFNFHREQYLKFIAMKLSAFTNKITLTEFTGKIMWSFFTVPAQQIKVYNYAKVIFSC